MSSELEPNLFLIQCLEVCIDASVKRLAVMGCMRDEGYQHDVPLDCVVDDSAVNPTGMRIKKDSDHF